MPKLIDISGQKFGRLTVITRVNAKRGIAYWHCKCDCGADVVRASQQIREGRIPSCGCARPEAISQSIVKHGLSKSPERAVLNGIINRCGNQNVVSYPRYGGRGITVCDRWRRGENGKSGVECFIEDMGRRPSAEHSIDRIDPHGDYEPGNCRWATRQQQVNNRCNTRLVRFNGRYVPLTEACREANCVVHYETAWRRIKDGWPCEQAFSTPPQYTNWPGRRRNYSARMQVDRSPV